MQLTRTMTLPKRRGGHRPAERPAPQRERNQRANVSQDAALWQSLVRLRLHAPVTTSVGCSHCAPRVSLVELHRLDGDAPVVGERAGEGNRTPIFGLGRQRLGHWTTPAATGQLIGELTDRR